jgi:hypothetical protein
MLGMSGRERQLPSLVELPDAGDCPHDTIEYWYTDVSYPDASGTARSVRLHKATRLIELRLWVPHRFFVKSNTGLRYVKPTTEEAEEGALIAYDKMTQEQRDQPKPVAIHVVLESDAKRQFYVEMHQAWYRHVMVVWEDDKGRVW